MGLNSGLSVYTASLDKKESAISTERRDLLEKIATFIREKRRIGELARLTFICTHNSRRSHFGQAWAQVAAYYYGVEKVECYSGGTEATAANPRTIAALQRAGFQVDIVMNGPNPQYRLIFAEGEMPVIAFSKVYDAPVNPSEDFVAIMTCTQADEECPFIPGAALRVALPYEDPKSSDDSPAEAATYDERCRQIATEMFYIFRAV
ncbi:MAG: protein-tyrosine-phosphatase [Lewinellaceae bacterium]|nr:protein-tyrosine-phosphatase [Phaeodactylibacter sp.]MCB0614383.1 protein-tyrosine-phosphatase [Phaeodactylibacter sp.]MCB9349812.1 protein-tyrosine-phosphatase [Lewinellaceae bacterium]